MADREQANERLEERLSAFVTRHAAEAKKRVDRRRSHERRWIEDLRQYQGKYDSETLGRIKDRSGSEVFMNLTRTKTDAMVSRMWDLLFPTDDRNWGIEATPVPELQKGLEKAGEELQRAHEEGTEANRRAMEAHEQGDRETADAAMQEQRAAEDREGGARQASDDLQERLNSANANAELMQEEIHDQLVACLYQAEARDASEDAAKIGTGILKGPVLGSNTQKRWREQQGEDGRPVHVLEQGDDESPSVYRVDPWSFFPDLDARKVEDCQGIYERHLMNKRQMRRMAQREGVDEDAVRDLIRSGPQEEAPAFMTELQDIGGDNSSAKIGDVFQVWEYNGPIDHEDIETLAEAFDKQDVLDDAEELDPLMEFQAKIEFCQGKALSFAIHPLDSGEPIYSVFNPQKSEDSVFGYGIPYIMRDPQSVLNAANRMLMDNSGLSAGPQIVIDQSKVVPANGHWSVTPMKLWYKTEEHDNTRGEPFVPYNIPSHQSELANLIELARRTIDEVTAMPQIAQGEQGEKVTQTAQGMAMLMNSANTVFRRFIKNFDDDVTTPLIRRFYDWNMQFSDKEDIKGDYDVRARGSSVLLVREMQANNLITIAQMFGDHPEYGPRIKHGRLLDQIFKALMVPSEEITKTEREYQEEMRRRQEQSDPAAEAERQRVQIDKMKVDAERESTEAKVAIAEMESQARLKEAQLKYETEMRNLAEKLNMNEEQLRAKLQMDDAKRQHDERRLATEVATLENTGKSAGGSV